MNSRPADQEARDRFAHEWGTNFAVVANAGSGKTTAISERLAAMAVSPSGAFMLKNTAVVTYAKKAASQIESGARSALHRRVAGRPGGEADALGSLDRVFFGTIHSFCLILARRHGSPLGIHLNPTVIGDGEDEHWQEFLEQDPMAFSALSGPQIDAFLRHTTLDDIFDLARGLDRPTAERLMRDAPSSAPPGPAPGVLGEIDAATTRKGPAADKLARNKAVARDWWIRFAQDAEPLPIASPDGTAGGIEDLFHRLFEPLKDWLARAGGALAGELSMRYRAWRLDRGIQTYADQVETAFSIVDDAVILEAIRREGWRVILDEAQDTDPKQFAVLVEITRPPGAVPGTWPAGGGVPPKPGFFCMVGDAQQGIFSNRADIGNFNAHVDAFRGHMGGERLVFSVTFRSPRRVVDVLNATLPAAFGAGREHNLGLPEEEGAQPSLRQVEYVPLVAGPSNDDGNVWILPIASEPGKPARDARLSREARQVAAFLAARRPADLGASSWGDVCILAPRAGWLAIVRDELEAAGLKSVLHSRRNRNGDNPVYAWLCGLLAVVCDPDNGFEWVGVLREVFSISDAAIARSLERGKLNWEDPGGLDAPVAKAVGVLAPFINRADMEADSLLRFASELAEACDLSAKARCADPDGGLGGELARLLARAADIGAAGGGPRAWLRDLLGSVDGQRPFGRPSRDSINLSTSHSAKGLEWQVVIPVGLWRSIDTERDSGLRMVPGGPGLPRLVYDNDSVPLDTERALERGRVRELVRLLYVTLTRPKRSLVIPWSPDRAGKNSFADLWGLDPVNLDRIPEPSPPSPEEAVMAGVPPGVGAPAGPGVDSAAMPADFPNRILPHQLAGHPDLARAALHESSVDLPQAVKAAPDPLEYGIWWHETLEYMPWEGDEAAIEAHGKASLARASRQGFAERAGEEWTRFLGSESLRTIRQERWTRLAEAGIFAPLPPDGWIDGVIDLVLHDAEAREVWIIDWKTNRRGAGEDDPALLARLCAEYRGQLSAYGACAAGFFPGCRVRLWVYSSVAGLSAAVEGASPGV
jgi:ATP-dependent exoDNAse (exonuclease V) beta subunit